MITTGSQGGNSLTSFTICMFATQSRQAGNVFCWYDIWYDTFNCNWIDNWWQYTFTHKQYTEQHNSL